MSEDRGEPGWVGMGVMWGSGQVREDKRFGFDFEMVTPLGLKAVLN